MHRGASSHSALLGFAAYCARPGLSHLSNHRFDLGCALSQHRPSACGHGSLAQGFRQSRMGAGNPRKILTDHRSFHGYRDFRHQLCCTPADDVRTGNEVSAVVDEQFHEASCVTMDSGTRVCFERKTANLICAPGHPKFPFGSSDNGDLRVSESGLEIPHPRWAEREFVLVPLAEIAPDFPASGKKTVTQWLQNRFPGDENKTHVVKLESGSWRAGACGDAVLPGQGEGSSR